MIEVVSIKSHPEKIPVIPLGDRYYMTSAKCSRIEIHTKKDGVFVFNFFADFVSNYRSGGLVVDRFVDQIGNADQQCSYLSHDAAYTPCKACNGEHPISKQVADDLLRGCLIYSGMSKVKANVVYWSVNLFGRKAYEEDDEFTKMNSGLFTFEWRAK